MALFLVGSLPSIFRERINLLFMFWKEEEEEEEATQRGHSEYGEGLCDVIPIKAARATLCSRIY